MTLDIQIPKLDLQYHKAGTTSSGEVPIADVQVFIDGSSRPNPGVMRVGISLHFQGKEIHRYSEVVGTGSNNNAEFCAMIQALQLLKGLENLNHPASQCKCVIISDSTLLVDAVNNKHKLKEPTLKEQLVMVLELQVALKQEVEVVWVPRAKNVAAHTLSYGGPSPTTLQGL